MYDLEAHACLAVEEAFHDSEAVPAALEAAIKYAKSAYNLDLEVFPEDMLELTKNRAYGGMVYVFYTALNEKLGLFDEDDAYDDLDDDEDEIPF